jgi:hypothetical protein
VNVSADLSSLGRMKALASWAEDLAQALLQVPLPRRWAHVQSVAARARDLAPVLGADADLLHAAAWLHDIGYAPGLALTGLHALDGARYLRDVHHAEPMLCRLLAHHSYAIIEAGERGLADVLALEFEPAPYLLSSMLTCCDMTTSPDGELVPVGRRLAEIHYRYGPAPGEPVHPARHPDDPPRSRPGSRQSQMRGQDNDVPREAWSWLEPGPIGSRNGSQSPFDKFELIR